MTISYLAEKVALLRERVATFIQQTAVTRVQIESLVGFLNWVTTIDPIGRIKLKEVIRLLGILAKRFERNDKRGRPVVCNASSPAWSFETLDVSP